MELQFLFCTLDISTILFTGTFLLTFAALFSHDKKTKDKQILNNKNNGSLIMVQIFKEFQTEVLRLGYSWPQFFRELYQANDRGSEERVNFLYKFCSDTWIHQIFESICEKKNWKRPMVPKFLKQYGKENCLEEKELASFHQKLFSLESPNPKAPALESFVEIVKIEERGRCLKATKDVSIGTTLAVETPVAARVFLPAENQNKIVPRCYHCFEEFQKNPVSCTACYIAYFCDEDCLKAAQSSYHSYECPALQFLNQIEPSLPSDIGDLLMAFKMICKVGPQKLFEMWQNPKEPTVDPSAIYERTLNLYHTVEKFSDWSKPVMCIILVKLLKQKTDFFNNLGDAARSEDFFKFVASKMLSHLEILMYNEFALRKTNFIGNENENVLEDLDRVQSLDPFFKTEEYGCALFTVVTFANHSCVPNAFVVFDQKFGRACLTASREIKSGNEIRISYGPLVSFQTSTVALSRINLLTQHYNFECDCVGCISGWPGMKEFTAEITAKYDDKTNADQPTKKPECLLQALERYRKVLKDWPFDEEKRAKDADFMQPAGFELSPSFLKAQDTYRLMLCCCVAQSTG